MALTNPNSVINVEKLSYFKGKLAKTDSAVAGQLVSAVSESGGIISVSRRALAATDVKLEAITQAEGSQYAAQYKLVAGSTQLGATINIPKDQFLKGAKLYASKAAADADDKKDYPTGFVFPGIRFEFQLSNTSSALWVSVKDLVDTYTGGIGINVTGTTISFKNGIGLAPDSEGKIAIIHDDSLTHVSQGEIGVNVGTGLELSEIATGSGTKLNVKLDGNTLARGENGIKVSGPYDATLEKVANKTTSIPETNAGDTKYPTEKAVRTELDKKQNNLSAGNGINLTNNVVSAKVVVANGLSVDGNGIKMATATDSTIGAVKVDGSSIKVTNGEIRVSADGNYGIDIDEVHGVVAHVDNNTIDINTSGELCVHSEAGLSGDQLATASSTVKGAVKVSAAGGLMMVDDAIGIKVEENQGLDLYEDGGIGIANNGVTTAKIKNDAVTADKVADNANLSGGQLATANSSVKGAVKVGSGLQMTGTSSDVLSVEVSETGGLKIESSPTSMAPGVAINVGDGLNVNTNNKLEVTFAEDTDIEEMFS